MTTRVLLTVDESTGSLAAVRALAAAGYAPHVATPDGRVYAARSRGAASVEIVPDAIVDPGSFVEALSAAARRLRAAAVLPGTEATIRALSGRESSLPASVSVGTCPPDVVARAFDKRQLHRLGVEAGLPVPETIELTASEV